MSFRNSLTSKVAKIIETKKSYSAYKSQLDDFRRLPHTKLTAEDKDEIRKVWGEVIPKVSLGYEYFEVFKNRTDGVLNPFFTPTSYLFPTISRCLNPLKYINALSYKGLYPTLFEGFKQAVPVIQCENAIITDAQRHIVTLSEAVEIIKSNSKPLIIKASTDTSGGRGVHRIDVKDSKALDNLLRSAGKDYVVQEFVNGSHELRKLNPYSLSTMRIMTLAMNGRITIHPSMLRIGGSKNTLVDNISSGGSCVGIMSDGILASHSYAYSGELLESANGHKFSDFKIPNFEEIKKFAIALHTRIPMCAIAGWDISLDEFNNPILIEVNLNWPSTFPQLCCGEPAFGDRTPEIIDYIKTVKKKNPFYFIIK